MICPNCKCEYVEGITHCPDCDVDLIEPEKTDSTSQQNTPLKPMEPVKLTSVDNNINAELLVNLLENNGIPCFTSDPAAGQYLNLYMGYSVYGTDIYVNKDDYMIAKQLLEQLSADNDEEFEEEIEMAKVPFYSTRQFTARVILVVMIIGIIVTAFMNF